MFARLYLNGLSSGDFKPVFRALLGEDAPLSSSAILHLKDEWAAKYRAWQTRSLTKHRYPYLWRDGVYIGCGEERDKGMLPCVLEVREDGRKELLALAIGDGGLGAWAALDAVFPTTGHQRCWNHRVLNVQDKLPQRPQAEARQELRAICEAPTRAEAEQKRHAYVAKLRRRGPTEAVASVVRD